MQILGLLGDNCITRLAEKFEASNTFTVLHGGMIVEDMDAIESFRELCGG